MCLGQNPNRVRKGLLHAAPDAVGAPQSGILRAPVIFATTRMRGGPSVSAGLAAPALFHAVLFPAAGVCVFASVGISSRRGRRLGSASAIAPMRTSGTDRIECAPGCTSGTPRIDGAILTADLGGVGDALARGVGGTIPGEFARAATGMWWRGHRPAVSSDSRIPHACPFGPDAQQARARSAGGEASDSADEPGEGEGSICPLPGSSAAMPRGVCDDDEEGYEKEEGIQNFQEATGDPTRHAVAVFCIWECIVYCGVIARAFEV